MTEPGLVQRLEALLGWAPEVLRPVTGGYSPALRYIASSGPRSAFVKLAPSESTARLLRREIVFYASHEAPFVPELIAADPDDPRPVLVTENLEAAAWPPPWTPPRLEAVLAAVAAMHRTPTTLAAGTLLDGREPGWPTVAEDPGPFLRLGLADRAWLDRALPALVAAEAACVLEGDALTHLDLRSDNLCLAPSGVKIVDWAEARRSRAAIDLGFFLPSLAFEGGPPPEVVLPDAPDIAALVSGFFAARAGLPDIPEAPRVRRVQRQQLSAALPWALRALGLPPIDPDRLLRLG